MANLRTWKRNLRGMVDCDVDYPGDPDHPSCPRCDGIMDFYGHDETGDFPLGEGIGFAPRVDIK